MTSTNAIRHKPKLAAVALGFVLGDVMPAKNAGCASSPAPSHVVPWTSRESGACERFADLDAPPGWLCVVGDGRGIKDAKLAIEIAKSRARVELDQRGADMTRVVDVEVGHDRMTGAGDWYALVAAPVPVPRLDGGSR